LNAFSGQRVTGNISGNINPQSFGFASSQTPGGGINGSGGATRFGLFPRNFFKQPNIWYVDARLSRRFSITERVKVEVLAGRLQRLQPHAGDVRQRTLYNHLVRR
jgi:hypothetical protein